MQTFSFTGNSVKPQVTLETFLALCHTCLALADCASYPLDRPGLNYILLGHLESDAMDGFVSFPVPTINYVVSRLSTGK